MKAREIAGKSQLKEEKPRFIMKRQVSTNTDPFLDLHVHKSWNETSTSILNINYVFLL